MQDHNLTEEDYKQKLTPAQYKVLREADTEPPFSGEYYNFDEKGLYKCAACGQVLFSSDDKYHSPSGWPSFNDLESNDAVKLMEDDSYGMHRIEVRCANCDSHLGHLFEGAMPTDKTYCINSLALDFEGDVS